MTITMEQNAGRHHFDAIESLSGHHQRMIQLRLNGLLKNAPCPSCGGADRVVLAKPVLFSTPAGEPAMVCAALRCSACGGVQMFDTAGLGLGEAVV